MGIHIDGKARREIERRRAHHRTSAILVRLVPLRFGQELFSVRWVGDRPCPPDLVVLHCEEAVLYVQRRVARYACWQDVTISACRLGPLSYVVIRDEPVVVLALQAWERNHPDPNNSAPRTGQIHL